VEVAYCAHFLMDEINDVKPNVIIAAGETALTTVTDKEKIGLWRGVPTEGPLRDAQNPELGRYKVFPTWHPAFVMRAQYNWPFAVHDLARAKAQSAYPEINRVPFTIIRQADAATHGAGLLATARARGSCTFDFETTGLSFVRDQILMCGFVARPDQGEVYDWTVGTQRLFQELLDDPEIEIVGQNVLNFDCPMAEEKGARIPWLRVFDTMVAFHLCNASYGQTSVAEQDAGTFRPGGAAEKDLAFLASNHTDIEYWKSREGYRNDLKGVCGVDCIATDRAATDLRRELAMYEMEDLYWKHVLPVHPVLKRMTRRGVRIDLDRAMKWSIALEEGADKLEEEFKLHVGDPNLNLASAPQMMKLLYETMKLPEQFLLDKKKGKRRTANAKAIADLAEQFPKHAALAELTKIRHYRKMKSTYIDPGLESDDGRVHPKFGVSKTSTGRMNSWDPNGQNVPEDMRDIWIPDSDEHVFISADWSQIEWRLAMVMSGDPVGLELLARGVDNHKAVAAETLRKAIEDITDEERHASKFIVYGLGYGRGAPSIAQAQHLDLGFVHDFINGFFSRFRVFKGWRDDNVNFVKKNHFLRNPYMRRRWWYTWEVTEVYNFPQQSTAGDMMYDALIGIDGDLPRDATLRLTVHDEVVVNTPKDCVREVVEVIKTHMERKLPRIVEASANPTIVNQFYPDGWFCPADIHAGTNWKMCKSKDAGDKIARAKLEKALGIN